MAVDIDAYVSGNYKYKFRLQLAARCACVLATFIVKVCARVPQNALLTL